jgi:hypothetical protein
MTTREARISRISRNTDWRTSGELAKSVVGYNDSLVQHFQRRLNLCEPFRLFHVDQIFHSH